MSKLHNKIIGHNSFFGINHLNYQKGVNTAYKFSKYEKIINLLEFAKKENVNQLMISTIEEGKVLINEIESNKNFSDLKYHILLPYINKYVRLTNEFGIIGTLKQIYETNSLISNFKFGYNFINFLTTSNIENIISSLVEIETNYFDKNKISSIILHDSLTDIIVSLKKKDILNSYIKIVKEKFKCKVGFATKNLPQFLKLIEDYTDDDLMILTHINKIGFEMNPSKEEVEKVLINCKHEIICMSILASGSIPVDEAFSYIKNLKIPNYSTVVGCSTKSHLAKYISSF